MRIFMFTDEPNRHHSLQELLMHADFTDDEFDAIASLEVGQIWCTPLNELCIIRLPDEPAQLPAGPEGRIDDPIGA